MASCRPSGAMTPGSAGVPCLPRAWGPQGPALMQMGAGLKGVPWQSERTSWRKPEERVSQAGEQGCPLLGLSLSTATHRKGVVSSPRHPVAVTHSFLTGCSLGWLGNSLELGCVTAVEMTSLGELRRSSLIYPSCPTSSPGWTGWRVSLDRCLRSSPCLPWLGQAG